MGKILKFCSSCDEGFAEKFTFCPDCGAPLQAFEMNPLEAGSSAEPLSAVEAVEPEAPAFIAEAIPVVEVEKPITFEKTQPTADEIMFASAPTEEIPAIEEPEIEEAPVTAVAAAPPVERKKSTAFMTAPGILFESEPRYADEVRHTIPAPLLGKGEDGYTITVIEEKNVRQRNWLLLGSTVFICTVAVMAWGISLFQKALDVGAIGDDRSLALLLDEVPVDTLEEKEQKKDKDDGGGGGGGGGEDQNPVSKGKTPPMVKDPQMAPSTSMDRLTNPSIPVQMAIKGPERTDVDRTQPYGYDASKYTNLSDGAGTRGGIGGGDNGGFGDGKNSGGGSGANGGFGGGNNGGIGDGEGEGGRPPLPVAKVTQPLKILSKQKAQYTDDARKHNVQGTVTLRVTFLASGGIGGITAIKGLPYGLTENAIAAARNLKFEPEVVNGVAKTVSRPVTFSFNIY